MSEITGLWIPLEYLHNGRLSRNEILIISYIKYRAEYGIYKGGNTEISKVLMIHKVRVSESISGLLSKGFLERSENKYYKTSKKYLDLKKEIVTETVTIEETVKVTETVTKSYGKRNSKVTDSVTLSYIEKDFNNKENNNSIDSIENEEKQIDEEKIKSSKVSSKKTSLPEIEFLDSEFKDFNVFEGYLQKAHPEIDTSFYYHKISSWRDKNTGHLAKRKIWKSTVNQFLENDYKRGELVTTKSKANGKSTNSNYPKQANSIEQQATTKKLDDLVSRYLAKQ